MEISKAGNLTLAKTVSLNTTLKPPNDKCVTPFYQGTAIVVINFVLVLVGTFGNFLIIFAVLNTRRLRQRASNFLLLSLAVADLLVTMCAQPLHAISMCFKTFGHYCVAGIDLAYDITGNFSFFCSIFHLSAISIDRALSATKPHEHQDIMKKKGLKMMLCTCWISAVVFVCLRVPIPSAMMLSIAWIFFNYAIIIIAYIVILYRITREKVKSGDSAAATSRNTARNARMEKRVSGTISIVILFFSICALPLVGFYLTRTNSAIRNLSSVVYMWIRTLALSNSSMNFIVYSFRIHHFRVAYLKILRNIMKRPRELLGFSTYSASLGASQESKNSDTQQSLTEMDKNKCNADSNTRSTIPSDRTNDNGYNNKTIAEGPVVLEKSNIKSHCIEPFVIPGQIMEC